jgi:hypothetical protein
MAELDHIVWLRVRTLTDPLIEEVLKLVPSHWVPVTDPDETIPEQGMITMWIHYGKWRDLIVICDDDLAFQRATWLWILSQAPNEIIFLPRHRRRLRVILGLPLFDDGD